MVGVSFLSLILFFMEVMAEGAHWPEHVVCSSPHLRLSYVSCDPFQDVGFTLNPCTDSVKSEVNSTIALLLKHSIEELYLSVDLFNGGGHKILHYDDTLCSRHRPRFTFCGRKKGEMINHEWPLKIKVPVQGQFIAWIQLVNQDGYQIACANATIYLD